MTSPAIVHAKYRMEAWAQWLLKQEQKSPVRCSLLGALLAESMEGYRRGGIGQLSKAFACLIRGSYKPDWQYDDHECWEVQSALDSMPRYMHEIKRVLYVEFLFVGTQESKAANQRYWPMQIYGKNRRRPRRGILLGTYKSLLNQGLMWLNGKLSQSS